MSTFNAGAIEASLTLDRSSWNRELKLLQQQMRRLEGRTITIGVDMDSDDFHKGAAQIELTSDQLGAMSPEIAVGMDSTEFHRAAAQVEVVTDAMSTNDIVIGVETSGVPKVEAELAALEAEIIAVDANDINIGIDYDRNNLERLVGNGGGSLASGGGGSMGLLQIAILAVIALSPILGVAISAAAAYVVAFAGAVVAALGPLALLIGAFIILIKYFKKVDAAARTPAMRFLAGRLADLQDIIKKFEKSDAAEHFFMAMGFAVDALNTVLEACLPLMDTLGRWIEGVAVAIDDFVNSSEFDRWLDFFGGFGLQMLNYFVNILGNLIKFLVNLFIAMEPFTKGMMKALVGHFEDLANWSEHLGKDKGFQDWLKKAAYYGPLLIDMLGELFGAFKHIGDAIEPFAEPMIKAIITLSQAIQDIPTDTLTLLIAVGVGLFVAWKVLVPLFSILSTSIDILLGVVPALEAVAGAFGLALGPFLLIIAAAAALAGMFVYLYMTNENLRKQVAESWQQIQDAVVPIIEDITQVIRDNWDGISDYFANIWEDVKGIFLDAFTIIHQYIFFATQAIQFIWKHFGDIILDTLVGVVHGIGQVLQGLIEIVSGAMALLADIMTGNWKEVGKDLEKIGRGFLRILSGLMEILWSNIKGSFQIGMRIVGHLWGLFWNALKQQATQIFAPIRAAWSSFVDWLSRIPGQIGHALHGMWDGLKEGFANAVNAIVDYWNGLSFGIPGFNPPGPGSFPGVTVSTPNLPRFASGAFVTDPTLAWVGEGSEPEIVSPVSKMAEIVKMYANKEMDYGEMSSAIVRAMSPFLSSALTPDMLERILAKAGVTIPVNANNDDRSVNSLVRQLMFNMRVLGYQGATP